MRIMRTRRGFWVVLHAEQRQVSVPHTFECLVVQVDVGQFDLAFRQRVGIDGEVVIVRSDLYLAREQLLHRMVSTVMSELEFEGPAAERDATQLVAQTNPKDWPASHQPTDVVDCVGAGLGITGAVRQEDAVGLQPQHIFSGRLRRDDRHFAAFGAQLSQDVLLDSKVIGDHVKPRRLVFYSDDFVGQVRALASFPNVGVVGRNDFRQVGAVHLRNRAGFADELVAVGLESRDHAAHHAVVAQVANQSTRVDIGKDGNFELLHVLVGHLLRAPVGAHFRKLADNQALDVRARGLAVFRSSTVVADFGVGENNDLSGIGRVSKNFLVAGNGSVENDFAGALAFGAVTFASEDAAVFERKDCLHLCSWGWILGILAGMAVWKNRKAVLSARKTKQDWQRMVLRTAAYL